VGQVLKMANLSQLITAPVAQVLAPREVLAHS